MIIRKFLHSCILIEENGKKLLIDPGLFSFFDKQIKPEDIGPVDAILITHNHPDHFYPEALRIFAELGCKRIIASEDIAESLKKEGLPSETIAPGGEREIASFSVLAIEASHGPLPVPIPHNLAYVINKKFLHAGDSLTAEVPAGINIQAMGLPTFAPWEKTIDSLDFAKRIKPRIVIPIHDWIIKEMPLERFYDFMYKPVLEGQGIQFKSLNLGESLEI